MVTLALFYFILFIFQFTERESVSKVSCLVCDDLSIMLLYLLHYYIHVENLWYRCQDKKEFEEIL